VAHVEGFEATYGVGFNFENPKYFAFAMYIHGSSALPLITPVDFMRVDQLGTGRENGVGTCGVPLVASLKNAPDQGLRFEVTAHDNAPAGEGEYAVVPPTAVSLSAWHTFEFFLFPHSNEPSREPHIDGMLQVWFDGVSIADWRHDWGCSPEPNPPYGTIEDKWRLSVGPVRAAQTPDVGVEQSFHTFFDNVRLAPSKARAE
jgi:hypothetical protein